ncbi:zinc ABC transporter substrate-binding protein [Pararhodobacter sp. SW119]|uniref:zinc ABC transporter substrate-binding protein n=1 Tax=Pararhodobacter sp. SW119 TaxID=2780075 RepID=UPI001ADEF15A|nr:zinc ABC transporter substrate-binding protein [Pararhodobacter sp. SW119]
MRYRSLRRSASLAAIFVAIGPHAAFAGPPEIVTDLPVTHSLVATVVGELATPSLLLDRGGDPHHFQLRPSQARAVSQAGLVVWMGPDLSPWMSRTVDALSGGAALELLEVGGIELQDFRESRLTGAEASVARDHDHGHDDHGEHDVHHQHGHDDNHDHEAHDRADEDHAGHHHEHVGLDPHAWMAPQNAVVWLDAIAATLADLDPQNAEIYRANADAGKDRILAMQAEIAEKLAPVGDAGLVMYHDAYGYIATAFGLNILGTIALGDAADPGAARLSAIRASLSDIGAVCVFPEVNHADAYVNLVSEGSGLKIGDPLDPAGVMLEPGAELYPSLMREMATAIASCVTED